MSLVDIINQRRSFVGREEQLASFRQNLILSPYDEGRLFIYNIWGQSGVGKTFLLRRFEQLAKEAKAITAWTNENQQDIPHTMWRIAEQFEQQGHTLKKCKKT